MGGGVPAPVLVNRRPPARSQLARIGGENIALVDSSCRSVWGWPRGELPSLTDSAWAEFTAGNLSQRSCGNPIFFAEGAARLTGVCPLIFAAGTDGATPGCAWETNEDIPKYFEGRRIIDIRRGYLGATRNELPVEAK
jgi:hypothetical protein